MLQIRGWLWHTHTNKQTYTHTHTNKQTYTHTQTYTHSICKQQIQLCNIPRLPTLPQVPLAHIYISTCTANSHPTHPPTHKHTHTLYPLPSKGTPSIKPHPLKRTTNPLPSNGYVPLYWPGVWGLTLNTATPYQQKLTQHSDPDLLTCDPPIHSMLRMHMCM